VTYQYPLRLDDNEKDILEELEELPQYDHLSRNDLIITAIKELSKKEFG
jgi:hypothetical protein